VCVNECSKFKKKCDIWKLYGKFNHIEHEKWKHYNFWNPKSAEIKVSRKDAAKRMPLYVSF